MGQYTIAVPLVLAGWHVLMIALFGVLRPRHAVVFGLVAGWLFLPNAEFEFRGIPNYDKVVAISGSLLLGVGLFDSSRLLQFKPRLLDLPILVFCMSPIPAAITNNLGLYAGLSEFLSLFLLWGVPYLLGRI